MRLRYDKHGQQLQYSVQTSILLVLYEYITVQYIDISQQMPIIQSHCTVNMYTNGCELALCKHYIDNLLLIFIINFVNMSFHWNWALYNVILLGFACGFVFTGFQSALTIGVQNIFVYNTTRY